MILASHFYVSLIKSNILLFVSDSYSQIIVSVIFSKLLIELVSFFQFEVFFDSHSSEDVEEGHSNTTNK